MSDYQREKNETAYHPHKKRGGQFHPNEEKTRQKQENRMNESTNEDGKNKSKYLSTAT